MSRNVQVSEVWCQENLVWHFKKSLSLCSLGSFGEFVVWPLVPEQDKPCYTFRYFVQLLTLYHHKLHPSRVTIFRWVRKRKQKTLLLVEFMEKEKRRKLKICVILVVIVLKNSLFFLPFCRHFASSIPSYWMSVLNQIAVFFNSVNTSKGIFTFFLSFFTPCAFHESWDYFMTDKMLFSMCQMYMFVWISIKCAAQKFS